MLQYIDHNMVQATVVMLILDIIWISWFMGGQYQRMIPRIQGSPLALNYTYATLAYCAMVIGYYFLVTDLQSAIVLGLVIYSVYDFTAAAVLKDWDMGIALIDILWGGVLFAMTYILSAQSTQGSAFTF